MVYKLNTSPKKKKMQIETDLRTKDVVLYFQCFLNHEWVSEDNKAETLFSYE